ncbi:MAG: DUF3343 domain-containing protein [Bacillota bacterium]
MLSFDSTHQALYAQSRLSKRIPVCVMPTLREVSKSCGISLRVEIADYPALCDLLNQGVLPDGAAALYKVEEADGLGVSRVR